MLKIYQAVVFVALGFSVALFAMTTSAEAAQIKIRNCIADVKVRICAFDNGTKKRDVELRTEDIGKFTCDANCKFKLNNCSDAGGCGGCGDHLDHSWGTGSYALVSLDRNKGGGNYSSSDLQNVGGDSPVCPSQ